MHVFARKGLVTLCFAALSIIWLADFVLEQITFSRLQAAQRRVGVLEHARADLLTLQGVYVDAETGQRGYLLTGDESYLAPYLAARARLDASAGLVRGLLGDPGALNTTLELGRAKLAELEETIELKRAGRGEEALALMRSGRGKDLMEQIRLAVSNLNAQLQKTAAEVADVAATQKRHAEWTSWIARALMGAALLGFYLAVRWIWRKREDALEAERTAKEATQQALASERAAHSEAAHANQLKDEFLGIVSHELRTPLSAILSWTSLLRESPPDEQEMHEGLETIERNARVQSRLVEDLLDVSRILSGKVRLHIRQVSLREVATAVLEGLRPSAQAKGIALEFTGEEPQDEVLGDVDRLQQVAWNLVSNAIKFTPRGGRVEVWVTRVDSEVELAVRDTGQGIREAFLPRVFERFSQQDGSTTRHNTGLGLGLAITRHLVELHGGRISAESAGEGRGTTFRVRIPIVAVREIKSGMGGRLDAAAAPVEPKSSLAARLDGLRVLAVDDQADARTAYTRILGRAGAEVRTAESVAEALAIMRDWKPALILSDIGMPGEDGYSFIRTVRNRPAQEGGRVPAVALPAFAKPEDQRRALEAGFDGHLAKPVDMHELTRKIAEYAGKAAPVP